MRTSLFLQKNTGTKKIQHPNESNSVVHSIVDNVAINSEMFMAASPILRSINSITIF
jgi:hypothetical protein